MSLDIAHPTPARIVGTGFALPKRGDTETVFTNADVIRRLAPQGRRGPRTEEEIETVAQALAGTMGVETRHWAHVVGDTFDDAEPTSEDLQVEALSIALDAAGVAATELAAVVTSTSTPARLTGSNGPGVAHRLGSDAAAYDIRTGCAGGLMTLVHGHWLAQSTGKPVGVVAGDTFSKLVPPNEPVAALAFGDGAAAAVIAPSSQGTSEGLYAAHFSSAGGLHHLGAAPSPFPVTNNSVDSGLYYLAGDPDAFSREALPKYRQAIGRVLELGGLRAKDLQAYVPHQSSLALIEAVRNQAGLGEVPTFVNVQRYANIGSGSALAALHEARLETNLSKQGGHVLMAALGGGMSWGALILRMEP